jgi:hypothetical protein
VRRTGSRTPRAGKTTNEIKRQTTSIVNAWVDAWTPKPKAKAKPARKRKSRCQMGFQLSSGEPGTTNPGNAARANVIHRKWHLRRKRIHSRITP